MRKITIYAEQHGKQSIHYHIAGVRPSVFHEKLSSIIDDNLPDGYESVKLLFNQSIHIVVKGTLKYVFHMDYDNERRGSFQGHAFHIYIEDEFKPIFSEIIKKCYPRSEVKVRWKRLCK